MAVHTDGIDVLALERRAISLDNLIGGNTELACGKSRRNLGVRRHIDCGVYPERDLDNLTEFARNLV